MSARGLTLASLVSFCVLVGGLLNDPSHNEWHPGSSAGYVEKTPFVRLPTSCTGPLPFFVSVNAWEEPNTVARTSFVSHNSHGEPVGLTGCEDLSFGPTVTISPDSGAADTPAGFTFDVKPPVGGLTDPEGLGSSDIENATVTVPEGIVINPGQAAGLEACQESEANIHVENVAPACPLKSKVGTDEAETPILKNALKGNVYLLQSNPPNLQLLIVASGEGVEVKVPIFVHLDEKTGQLVAKVDGEPQAPVSDFKLSFSGGAQAALATPTMCGTYTTTADFTPWASPMA